MRSSTKMVESLKSKHRACSTFTADIVRLNNSEKRRVRNILFTAVTLLVLCARTGFCAHCAPPFAALAHSSRRLADETTSLGEIQAVKWSDETHPDQSNNVEEGEISVVRGDDSSVKYFIFKGNKFNVKETDGGNGKWVLLNLRGHKQIMADRWFKINKSIGFLNYLLKDGALKSTYPGEIKRSKSDIRDVLVRQSPDCSNCKGTGLINSWWSTYSCPDCSISCRECKLGKWMRENSLQNKREASAAEAKTQNSNRTCFRCGNKGIDKCKGTGHDLSQLRNVAPDFFPTV